MNKMLLSIKMRFFLIISIPVLTMLFPTLNCKQKGRNTGTQARNMIAFEDIKIGYPDIEGQKIELQKFNDIIDAKSATEKPDEVLRQIVEHVPFEYIQTHLQELSQNTSPEDKPNIFILLERISEMRNLDYDDVSEFIEKAKENRNVEKLNVALFGLRTETQQTKAAEALMSLKKPESVRLLTMRLFNAAGYPKGGSEDLIYRKELRRSLVRALGSCTSLDFSNYDASEAATLEVVKHCEDWLMKKGKEL